MDPFVHVRPGSVPEALTEARGHDGAAYLAGGTTLVDLMRDGVARPSALIDLRAVPGLDDCVVTGDTLVAGAMLSNAALARATAGLAGAGLVTQAVEAGASRQLRAMATLGGNLLQSTRCAYFRDVASPCDRREPGTGCGAVDHPLREHAILGGGTACIATHPSDLAVALVAHAAVVTVARPDGSTAEQPVAALLPLPGSTPWRVSTLADGDLVTAVRIPLLRGDGWRVRYLKVRDRAAYAFALAAAAVAIRVDGDEIAEARVALGGVATRPWRAEAVERALIGRPPTRATFATAADAAADGAVARPATAYKVTLIRRTVARALEQAAP